jgi:CPA2 family monovalent cation:H+ antiporter-2
LLGSLSDFFQAIFFTALGGLVLAPDLEMIFKALVLVLVVLLVTPPLVTILAERTGLNSRAALESGLLLAQTSEFALVLGLAGSVLGQIDQQALSIITLVSVMTMTLTPFVATDRVNRFLLRFHPLRRRLKEEPAHRDHVLMLGFGAGGMWVVKPLRQAGYDVVVVEDDPAVIDQLQKAGIPCLRGDGADEKILSKAGANGARLILSSMPRAVDAEKVLHHVRSGVPVLVRVFEESDAIRIRQLGGIPILNAAAAADTFMEWFEKTMPRDAGAPTA